MQMVVTLGALLADVPHTRPVPHHRPRRPTRRSSSASACSRRTYEGPTGIVGVLHAACQDAGIPSASLWASVPHYVAAAPNPKAALALVRKLESLVGVAVDASELESAAADYERQVSLRGPERPRRRRPSSSASSSAADEEEPADAGPQDLPSGDVLAREFQRFLRQRGPGRRAQRWPGGQPRRARVPTVGDARCRAQLAARDA